MRTKGYIALLALAVLVSCGGTAKSNEADVAEMQAEEVIIDCDSLLQVMDARYNDLCERRKEAFAECDAVRRAELIAESDRACGEFADSLEWLLQLRAMQ